MLSDLEIRHSVPAKSIIDIADQLDIPPSHLFLYGHEIAKVDPSILKQPTTKQGNLILVSATTPTAAGEGKTTTSIGLAQALAKLDKSVCLALREPSLGPCLGMKGGATGGGQCQLIPADRINLHFTGDMHAITSAHNFLSAMIDNHIYHGNERYIDPCQILWRRVIDLNDRSLRHTVLGLGGKSQGIPREGGFDISAASELMAMLCLATDMTDLKQRLAKTLLAFTYDNQPVYARDLEITDAVLALLRDTLQPNLVQTLEGVPALIHGGPFANIAHGCNSLIATRLACHLADYAITEAGFGFDLGAEKFFDIKCRIGQLNPAAVVLVTTVRALKLHGGKAKEQVAEPDLAALRKGFVNLEKHIENVTKFNLKAIVGINCFDNDSRAEIDLIKTRCQELDTPVAVCHHFQKGGDGALELAAEVMNAVKNHNQWQPLYDLHSPVEEKIRTICREIYGADDVAFSKQAAKDLNKIKELGFDNLPVCIAKAPGSLSDDPKLIGRPRHFDVTVRAIQINSGAGFLVVLTGDILRMPGLPKHPAAERWQLHENGSISGMT